MKGFQSLLLLSLLALTGCATSNSVVNLSHYDHQEPDFVAMKQEGVAGVIHEATFPLFNHDEAYVMRQAAAIRSGLLWGAYHLGDASDPVAQADHFLDYVRSSALQNGVALTHAGILLVLDFEQNTHYPGGTMRVEQAAAFIERIRERTGIYPGLYASENRIRKVLNDPALNSTYKQTLRSCWLWIANYHHKPRATAPWKDWKLWQYTGDGMCELPRGNYPISLANFHNAERNIFHGSQSDLARFWETHAWHPD
jgi:lysozyme